MWAAGLTAGLMWRATNPDGSLAHSFLASLIAMKPFYVVRFLGGVLVFGGMAIMFWNLWRTAADARAGTIKPIFIPSVEPIAEPVPQQYPAPLPANA
jgi:cytochrome c oxidase cbb3-type subunit I